MQYTIGEIAKKLNIAPSALRYYDKEGLLPYVERTESGIRKFYDSDIEMLLIIECLKKTGLSISKIKVFVDWCVEGDSTIDQRLNLISQQREAVLQQIEEMKISLEKLDYKKWFYETAKEEGTCAHVNALEVEHVPPEYQKGKRMLSFKTSSGSIDRDKLDGEINKAAI